MVDKDTTNTCSTRSCILGREAADATAAPAETTRIIRRVRDPTLLSLGFENIMDEQEDERLDMDVNGTATCWRTRNKELLPVEELPGQQRGLQ